MKNLINMEDIDKMTLQTLAKVFGNAINALANRMSENEKNNVTLTQYLPRITDLYKGLHNDVTIIKEDLSDVKTVVGKLDSKVDKIEKKVNSFEAKQDSFENKLDSFENKLDSFENKLDSFEAKQNSFEAKQNSFENKMDKYHEDIIYNIKHVLTDQIDKNIIRKIEHHEKKMH